MTIDRYIRLYAKGRSDSRVNISNTDARHLPESIDLAAELTPTPGHWTNYMRAAMQAVVPRIVEATGRPALGFDVIVDSELPAAAGLSSSSALVIATCQALLHANGIVWTPAEVAERMTLAERFVGTAGGGMDQAAISLGETNAALLIEFSPLRTTPVPLPEGLSVFIINSGEKAEKTGAARFSYNRRSLECALAVAVLANACRADFDTSAWVTLRDVYDACNRAGVPWSHLLTRHLPADGATQDKLSALPGSDVFETLCESRQLALAEIKEWLPEGRFQLYARAAHVLGESDRVYAFKSALERNELPAAGLIANASHHSCRDLYQISTPNLERLRFLAMACGAIGVRITGAGFGGCLIAFVPAEKSDAFETGMQKRDVAASNIIRARPGGRAHVLAL